MSMISCSFLELIVFYVFKMKVKVTHKECFARKTVRVFKEVGKLIEKDGVTEFVIFAGWSAVDTE